MKDQLRGGIRERIHHGIVMAVGDLDIIPQHIAQEDGCRKRLIEREDQGLSRRRWIAQEGELARVEDLLLEVGWAESQLVEGLDGQAMDRQRGLGGEVADGDDRGEDASWLQAVPT